MRELKFRAWHGGEKAMYQFQPSGDHAGQFEWLEVPRDEDSNRRPSIRHYKDWSCSVFDSDFHIMQYTGLKDKNGTPIFEGDILATSNDGTDGADVWSKEDYGYAVVREDTDNLFDGVRCKNWYPNEDNTEVYNTRYVEVIGNVYENPDLLA